MAKIRRIFPILVLSVALFVCSALMCTALGETAELGVSGRAAKEEATLSLSLVCGNAEYASGSSQHKLLEMNEYSLKVHFTLINEDGKPVQKNVDVSNQLSKLEVTISGDSSAVSSTQGDDCYMIKTVKPSDGTVSINVAYTYDSSKPPCEASIPLTVVRLKLASDAKVLTHAALASLCYSNKLPIGKYIRDFLPDMKNELLFQADEKIRNSAPDDSASSRHFIMAAAGDYQVTAVESYNGFFAVVFDNPSSRHRVIAFRGTNPFEFDDVMTDFLLGLGFPGNYQFEKALTVYNTYKNTTNRVSLTGHSLGGGLANYVSLLTGADSTTFNAPSTFITTINTNLHTLARSFSGINTTNYTDYANPEDWVAAAGVGDNPQYAALSVINVPELMRHTAEYRNNGKLDKTYMIADQSRWNGTGPAAPYHFIKQMLKLNWEENEISIQTTSLRRATQPVTVRIRNKTVSHNSDYVIGTSGKDTVSISGSHGGCLLGGGQDDNLFADSLTYFQQNKQVTSIVASRTANDPLRFVGGTGNDTISGSNFSDTYVYLNYHGIDTIRDSAGQDIIQMPDHSLAAISTRTTATGHDVLVNGSVVMHLQDCNGFGTWTIQARDGSTTLQRGAASGQVREYIVSGPVTLLVKNSAGETVLTTAHSNYCCEYGTVQETCYNGKSACQIRITDPSLTVSIVSQVSVAPKGSLRVIPRDTDGPTFDFAATFTTGDTTKGWSVTGIPVYSGSTYTPYDSYEAGILKIDYDGDGTMDMEPVYEPMTTLTIDESVILPYAETHQLTLTAEPAPKDGLLLWSSSDPLVASVDENGLISALSSGTAVVTVEALDGSGLTASCTVTVPDAAIALGDCTITFDDAAVEFTGTAFTPEVSVTYLETELLPHINYNIVYADNVLPGTASISLTGIEPFTGEVTLTFQITAPVVPTLEEKVAQLHQQCLASGAATDYDKTVWFHDWLINNATYDYDLQEYYADGVLLKGTGVCQSYALALQMLLDAAGITNQIVISDEMDHAWNLVLLEGSWCHIDCTWDDPGTGGGENHTYFGLNDDFMARDHVWIRSNYPACTSLDLNYYLRNKVYPGASSQEELDAVLAAALAEGNGEITVLNTAAAGFDLLGAIDAWYEENGWRYEFTGFWFSGTSNLATVTLENLNPSAGAAEYTGDQAAFEADIEALLARRCTSITLKDSTDAAFDCSAFYDQAELIISALASEHGSILSPSYRYSDAGRYILLSLSYLTSASLPEPFELTAPVSGHTFSMTDSSGKAITEATYAGKRVLQVYGRLTCPNTMALLSSLNAAASLLTDADVEVVVGLFDLYEGDLETADEQFRTFHCVEAGAANGMWEALEKYGLLDGSVIFPVVLLRETNGDLIYCSTGYVNEPLRLISTAASGVKISTGLFELPAVITEVEAEAFMGCSALFEVSFAGSQVQSIGDRAFAKCSNLLRITIPESVTHIGEDAFEGCSSLTIICTPNSTAYWYAVNNGLDWSLAE